MSKNARPSRRSATPTATMPAGFRASSRGSGTLPAVRGAARRPKRDSRVLQWERHYKVKQGCLGRSLASILIAFLEAEPSFDAMAIVGDGMPFDRIVSGRKLG